MSSSARSLSRLAPALALAVLAVLPLPAHAQYFGRNKVQYETFDFRVMETEHFDIHFYPEEAAATQDAARMAERWYTRLSNTLQHGFAKKPIILYANHPDFQQTNVIGGLISEGTGGVTEGLKNRVVMPYTGIYAGFDHVLGHELVHAFQYDIAAQPQSGGLAALGRIPLWMIEGMAEYLSVGRVDAHTAMWLRDAVLREDVPTMKDLNLGRVFPYRFGQGIWAYIAGKWGDNSVQMIYRFATRIGVEGAIRRVTGISSDSLSKEWRASLIETYQPLIAGRTKPADLGAPVLGDPDEEGAYNLSPQLSPDGRYVAFFSSRNLFGIDLFLADAQTGKILKKLASPTSDPHFDAISFINSAGTWSPDGRKMAFIVFAEGDNELAILDVQSRDVERRIALKGVGAITDPAWSPDGNRIAVSGIAGGISDIYVVDIASNEVQQLTDDKYADIQPAWSPDGRTLAFATDRGPGTDFERLTFAPLRIATMDVATGAIELAPSFENAKHINPAFSPDGSDLYFISDREGFSDIYRLSRATGELFQVTRMATGVSGITHVSPAMSVARSSGRVMFSVFRNGGFTVHALDAAQARGEPVTATPGMIAAAEVLPPVQALQTSPVRDYLGDPLSGLPSNGAFDVRRYRPGLQLDYIGGPAIGAGVNSFGTQIAGGVSAYFSDMLGNRVVGATIQAQGELKDIGGQVFYQNLRSRWNWGAGAAHIPYLSGLAGTFVDENNNIIVRQELYRIFVDEISGLAQYPFSTTRRFETSLGFTRLGYDFESREFVYDGFGRFLGERRENIDSPSPIYYAHGMTALVGDNSFFGFTSPIAGGRYRIEAASTLGTLSYQTGLVDFRRYFFFRPLTLAFRGMHYGRYGKNAESNRLQPLYVGYETLIRGYAFESFDPSECTRVPGNDCPEFNRLLGSKLGILNAELRIPLLGPEVLALIPVSFLPVEIAPFFDAGVAWTDDESPELRFDDATTDRVPVFSAGVSARINVFGYIIFETYYAKPFQRPERGWHFGFNLAPGW